MREGGRRGDNTLEEKGGEETKQSSTGCQGKKTKREVLLKASQSTGNSYLVSTSRKVSALIAY